MNPDAQDALPVTGALDLPRTLDGLLMGRADPCLQRVDGGYLLAEDTADGPVTLALRPVEGALEVAAWGPGAAAGLAVAGRRAGLHDDPLSFRPPDPRLRDLVVHFRGLRMAEGGPRFPWLCRAILGQLVTTIEAGQTWRALVRALGRPAPGPFPGLLLAPRPADLAAAPAWRFESFGILPRLARTLRRAAVEAAALDDWPADALDARLDAIPGIGPWTTGLVRATALGDPDTLIRGDLHLPGTVGQALVGEPRADDDRMEALLEPYRPHRYRLVRLLIAAHRKPVRRGPLPEARRWG